jgi:hypothetical protein
MKFRIEHVFAGIDLASYEQLYFDEPFNIGMCQATKLGRDVVKRDSTAKHLSRVVRVTPERDIPAPVAKVLGGSRIEYVENIEYDWGSNRGTWRTDSSILSDKIACGGTLGFEARSNGVLRWLEGEIKVKIFGIGGIVERFVVADIEKSYEQATAFMRKWIVEKGGKA